MATITFKGKAVPGQRLDLSMARFVAVPKIATRHCDMAAFRSHPKIGAYANSNLFPGIIARELSGRGIDKRIDLDRPPPGVAIDESVFLVTVTITVE